MMIILANPLESIARVTRGKSSVSAVIDNNEEWFVELTRKRRKEIELGIYVFAPLGADGQAPRGFFMVEKVRYWS